MSFNKEIDFEKALIEELCNKGWEDEVLVNPTEGELIQNWANILFNNNRTVDRLNNEPLTESEMEQIIEQIISLKSPLKLNSFINGKTVSITRDNVNDKLHYGKEVSLKIYDRREIAAGQSRYQIVRQPKFKTKSKILGERRGDISLLINGMPVFHLELKRSGIPLSQAYNQIEKYSYEGVFSGLFSLIQVFVAMTPEDTVYFANPGVDGTFNKDYYFQWADFDNEPITDWKSICAKLLNIPMAHELIGYYTVADNSDGVLKVMRSYQYNAAYKISSIVSKLDWNNHNQLGGHIWHTTGSGKTMTSFKSAQLIANSKDADKVIFLTDRVELGTQSLKEYKNFADESEDVQATENTKVLITKMKSSNPADTLIVTSIQKMSNIKDEEEGLNGFDIEVINEKRIVFIVDEAHRSTFGDMLVTIKKTFKNALFFGFTGTPISKENEKKLNTTTTIFGEELHRYSIADGIRDRNVLGFDIYKVSTFKDIDLRKAVALHKAKAKDEADVFNDKSKTKIYYKYMNDVAMTGHKDENGRYVKGIEDYVPKEQYKTDEHKNKVVEDIINNYTRLSRNYKFHSIFATTSINEAIEYYRIFKEQCSHIKVTCLFDPNIDNTEGFAFKEDGLVEIIEDYNKAYNKNFTISTHSTFKKDIAMRLAHKEHYKKLEKDDAVDILIVVDQMLTGFDSKWINTLYIDKVMVYENIIQAFSRTNRLFGHDKPFGTIRYYRKTNTMDRNIKQAVETYSGNRPVELFVDKLKNNVEKLNHIYKDIKEVFESCGNDDFSKLPLEVSEKAKFASLFKEFNLYLEASKIQGFDIDKIKDEIIIEDDCEAEIIFCDFGKEDLTALTQRYKELSTEKDDNEKTCTEDSVAIYDLVGYIIEADRELVDNDYMNSRFKKYLRLINQENISEEEIEKSLNELHKTFATLSQEEQKYANIFLHDLQNGTIIVEEDKTLKDYITLYLCNAKDDEIRIFANTFGIDENKLRHIMSLNLNDKNMNEYGRFDDLKSDIDKSLSKKYFEEKENKTIPQGMVNMKMDKLLRKFLLDGGIEI